MFSPCSSFSSYAVMSVNRVQCVSDVNLCCAFCSGGLLDLQPDLQDIASRRRFVSVPLLTLFVF